MGQLQGEAMPPACGQSMATRCADGSEEKHRRNADIEAKTPGWWSTSSSWSLSSPRHRGTVVVCDDAQRENFSQVVNDDAKEKRGEMGAVRHKTSSNCNGPAKNEGEEYTCIVAK